MVWLSKIFRMTYNLERMEYLSKTIDRTFDVYDVKLMISQGSWYIQIHLFIFPSEVILWLLCFLIIFSEGRYYDFVGLASATLVLLGLVG